MPAVGIRVAVGLGTLELSARTSRRQLSAPGEDANHTGSPISWFKSSSILADFMCLRVRERQPEIASRGLLLYLREGGS